VSTICPACGSENQADARFCRACGTALAGPSAPEAEARKTVTVVFSDVVGSTLLGHGLDPESLLQIMARYFEAMRLAIERHGGSVEKFIGDAVMAVFGIPQVHEDDALRAVRAAAEMREALEELNAELARTWGFTIETRTGINTGEVFVGDRTRGQDPILGDPVNIAARLEQSAAPGQILLGETTYQLVRDAVSATTVGPLAVKGKPEPLAAWQLHEIVPGASGWARNLAANLVGRDRELRRLEDAFARVAAEGSCEIVTVFGPAGAGKSRLGHELTARLGDEATVVEGRCLPYGEGITFWPIASAVMDAAGIGERDRPELSRRKISELLGTDGDSALVAERLAPLLGVDPGRAAIQETFWGVRKLFEHLGSQRPLVAVFDDIQWGEPTFLDLLEYLADWVRGAPVLLLCLARPELLDVRPEWVTPKANAELVTLTPLTAHETDGLIQGLLDGDELEPEARVRITEMAEGNPLFVEQTLRMLVDDGALERRNGRWTATQDLSRITIPPTISALLTARLARLDAGERAVVERASIVGRVFWWAAVAEISGGEVRPHVISHLQSLTRKELIRPDYSENGREASFRFGHILIRDAAYHGIPKGERAELHERLADWLEVEARDMAGEFEEILGYHVEQARRLLLEVAPLGERAEALGRRAASILGGAGRRAFDRGDMPAAVNLLSRAVAVTPARTRERAELLAQLAFALLDTGDLERLEDVVDEMTRTAVASHIPELEPYAAIMGLWLILSWNPEGWAEAADRKATEAIAAFEAAGDERGLAKAWALLGLLHIERAEFRSAEDAWTRAAAHAHRSGDRRDELESLSWVPLAVWAGPTPVDEGLRRCADVLARADGDKKLMASALIAQAVLEADTGRVDDARRDIARAKALLEEVALVLWLAGPVAQFAGWVELLAGDPARAEAELRGGYERLAEIGELSWLSTIAGLLAEAVHRQGRVAEAERLAAASEESAGAEDAYSHALVQSVRAKVLAGRGDTDGALRHGRRAVALADTTDFVHLRVHARLAEAEALRAAGADPRPRVEEAIALAEAKGSRAEARLAREMLPPA